MEPQSFILAVQHRTSKVSEKLQPNAEILPSGCSKVPEGAWWADPDGDFGFTIGVFC